MIDQINAEVGCVHVGEFVDEAELPANAAYQPGEVVRPRRVFNYHDDCSDRDSTTESLIRVLIQAVREESHGPSRARMVESLVRLQAVETLRDVLAQPDSPDAKLHNDAVHAIAKIFTPNDAGLDELPSSMSESLSEAKSD